MKESKLYIKYRVGGEVFVEDLYQTTHYYLETVAGSDSLVVRLIPRTELELIDFELRYNKDYGTDVRFFANGYQAWTTSKEYASDQKIPSYFKLADISEASRKLISISGDYLFNPPANKPGIFSSYTYCYIRHENEFQLYGSRSERTGFTIFKTDMKEGTFTIKKDVEGLKVNAPVVLLDVVTFTGSYDEVFDAYFGLLDLPAPRIDHLSGYTSWYNYFQKIDESIILRDLEGLTRVKQSANIFQIDDGYETFVGDWLDPSPKFPRGMKYVADRIHEKGLLAGIWLAPFNAQKVSRIANEHPEWLITDNQTGKPLLGCAGWGGAYTLDIYNAEARAYIKNVFDVVLNDWGYDMVKLDFLYSQCMQPRYGKSRGMIMCEAMEFLRECVGDKLILGCGVPLGAAFGYVDACRISCDVDLVYRGKYYNKLRINHEIPSAQNAINNTVFRRHLNGRAFLNDPDVFFLRNYNLKFSEEQKLLLAKINHLFGSVLFVSDDVGRYGEKELDLVCKTFKKSNAIILSVDLEDNDYFVIRYLEDGEKKELVFNLKTGTK